MSNGNVNYRSVIQSSHFSLRLDLFASDIETCKHISALLDSSVILDQSSSKRSVGEPLFLELHLEGIHTVPVEGSRTMRIEL